MREKYSLTPAKVIMGGFFIQILAGTALLLLPRSAAGRSAAPLEAFFTATSATCVTGLAVVDTATFWSPFGHAVILTLIQAGGLGFATLGILISSAVGRRVGLKERFIMQESVSVQQTGGIVRFARFIARGALVIELAGTLLLALRFCPSMGLGKGLWFSLFHSVSAFCNAGFDLFGTESLPFASLTGFYGDWTVNAVIAALIVLGGLGFFVWDDLCAHKMKLRACELQTKVVLSATAVLIAAPALFLYAAEFSRPEWSGLTAAQKGLASFFQSVTTRTAGFNTVDLTQMSAPSLLVMGILMLIGGSPGSTAGGVKTTTAVLLLLCIRTTFRRRHAVECFDRRVDFDVIQSAVSILFTALALTTAGAFVLVFADGVPLGAALFETASAVGTVGLSLSVTPQLGALSRLTLIALMFCGRAGFLTLLYTLANGQISPPSQLPQGKITLG
ncbi:MAG: potassium transporter TrkG [Pyramidobacter sp.]|nr:potassium transporter TrkG [Pyramidobacter sp.]